MKMEGCGSIAGASEGFICYCLKIREADVIRAVRAESLRSLDDIRRCTEAGEGCTACHPALRRILKRYSLLPDVENCSAR